MTGQVKEKQSLSIAKERSTSDDYYQTWLNRLAELMTGLQSAVLYLPIDDELLPLAQFQAEHQSFTELNQCLEQHVLAKQPQVTTLETAAHFALLYPVFSQAQENKPLIAYAGFCLQVTEQAELTQALTLIELAMSAVEVLEYQHRQQQADQYHQFALHKVELLAKVLSEQSYQAAAMRFVTEFAQLLTCDRISFGVYQARRSQLKHLSHNAQFGKKMNQVRQLESVMDEAIDQDSVLLYAATDQADHILLAHQALSEQQGGIALASFPLYQQTTDGTKIYGAMVIEAQPEQSLTLVQVQQWQSLANLILPILLDKQHQDHTWLTHSKNALSKQTQRLFGAQYLGRKLIVGALACTAFTFSVWHSDYKLSTDALVESAQLQAIVAPYDGYIDQAQVRAGDLVKQDDLLIGMDDRDLHLEKLKWRSEQGKLNRQYLEALAIGDRAKINIIKAQEQQVSAQLELIESQLQRAQLTAPYDGLIVSGDLSQRLGGAVTKGDVLFEVAPRNSYRVKLSVKESRIADLQLGQRGVLYLSALPEQGFEFTVSNITPITEMKDGQSFFIVEADLLESHQQLRPGMAGVGKVEIDQRLAIGIWTRDFREWLDLQLWSFWG